MVSSQVVANTFLYHAFNEDISITPMKLQKLMYFLYREYAQKTGQPLFSDQFEAWKYGPVLSNIYYIFQNYGSKKINKFARNVQGRVQILNLERNPILKECWNTIWSMYKNCSGPDLSAITHKSNTAWDKAVKAGNNLLDFKDILEDNEY